jgi:aquaglyceroporin related protein
LAEFFGVAVFVLIGTSSNCQVALSSNPNVTSSPKGDYLSLSFGWAIGLALAVWISAGISGGHVNPAITLVLATRRKFPWKKVPVYIFAQVMGGVIGAALSYAQYFHAIDIVEGGRHVRTQATASLFGTYALNYMTAVSCFFSEFLGTAVLAFMIIAATDKKNAAPPLSLLPLVIFLTLLGLAAALGMQTSFAFNPARDFGPRIFLGMAGYGRDVFNFRNQYWLWCPIIAPIAGAQVSVVAYDLFLKDHSEDDAIPGVGRSEA